MTGMTRYDPYDRCGPPPHPNGSPNGSPVIVADLMDRLGEIPSRIAYFDVPLSFEDVFRHGVFLLGVHRIDGGGVRHSTSCKGMKEATGTATSRVFGQWRLAAGFI